MRSDAQRFGLMAAVLAGGLAVFAMGFFVALGVRSVVAVPDSAPAASPSNPGHPYSQIDLPVGTWSGLDADTVDGMDATGALVASQFFTSSGTFTAPTGVTTVYVTMAAGGGAGSGADGGAGGRGGGAAGGCLIKYPYAVTPGNNYTVTVGTGGAGGWGNGAAGTDSVFGDLTVLGGNGGSGTKGGASRGTQAIVDGGAGDGSGGAGGTAVVMSGGGGDGADYRGGGGGASPFGNGGAGGALGLNGNDGSGYGSGGGGSGGASDGGSGTAGFVLVEW